MRLARLLSRAVSSHTRAVEDQVVIGQGQVLADGEIRHQPLALAVLRDEADPRP